MRSAHDNTNSPRPQYSFIAYVKQVLTRMLDVLHGRPPTRLCRRFALLGLLACLFGASTLSAAPGKPQPPKKQPPKQEPRKERILFVPFDDLSLILSGPNERVFMTREEYRALQAEAAKRPPSEAPQATILLNAAYNATIQETIATVHGQLELEVLAPGLQAIPLVLQGVSLRQATLDGQPASIGRDAKGQYVLFVHEPGRHQLQLELLTPVVVAAAQQSLQFQLPKAASTTLHIVVPGNVEVKRGASIVRRQYDQTADQTRFELLPEDKRMALVMSLNNRRLLQGRVVAARSVLVSELTTSYERLHATVQLSVLHGAVDRFLFDVPNGFQITGVASPLLAQWVLRKEGEQEVLEVTLREPTRATEEINISASRAPVAMGRWTMPQLKPRDVAGHVAVVGLVAESQLRPLGLTATNLIHLDTSVLRDALPASVFDTEPGAPSIRQIAAYYAPGGDFSLSATLEDPEDELRVATHMLLSLDAQQQTLRGGFTLTPQASKLTAFAFQLPADWRLDRLYDADQKPLEFDRYRTDGNARFVVTLAKTIQPSQSQTVFFIASHRSSAWLTHSTSKQIKFPRVQVEQATDTSGAISVQANGDLIAKPTQTDGLVPLDSKERNRFGLGDSTSELTYQVTAAQYHAEFLVQRKQPKISTRNYSFFRVREGVLLVHHEVVFLIERARASQLELRLPESTPAALAITGLDNVQLKEFSHITKDGHNHWTVQLAKPQRGTVRLAIDYEQPLKTNAPNQLELPVVRTTNVAYQTQMVTIEGDPTLDISIHTKMRSVDVGELAEADYMPGARLLGSFASTTDNETVRIDVTRRQLVPLPPAIVKRAELVTIVATRGVSQSSARYLLQTKVPYLAIELPKNTELWSVILNGQPIKPRRRGNQVLLSLQTDEAHENRDLQVVYQTPVNALDWLGEVRTHAPQLRLLLDEQDQGLLVPQVDLVWHLLLPRGYSVSRVRGTVFSSNLQRPESPLTALARAALLAGGNMPGPTALMHTSYDVAAKAQLDTAATISMEVTEREHRLSQRGLADHDFESSMTNGLPAEGLRELGAAGMDSTAAGRQVLLGDNSRSTQGVLPPMPGDGNGNQPQATPQLGTTAESAITRQIDPYGGYPSTNAGGSPQSEEAMNGQAAVPNAPDRYGMPGTGGDMAGGMGGGGMGGGGTDGYGMAGEAVLKGGQAATGGRAPSQPSLAALPSSAAGVTGSISSRPAAASPSGAMNLPQRQQGRPATQFRAEVRGVSLSDGSVTSINTVIGKYWALQGVRGLAISLDQSDKGLTFRSLGTDPVLDVTVFHKSRMNWLALAVALAIIVFGLLMAHRRVATRIRFVVLMSILACGLPLLGGPLTEFAPVFQQALLATLALIPIWVFLAVVTRTGRWILNKLFGSAAVTTAALLLAALSVTGISSVAQAQDLNKILAPLLEAEKPIHIPDDAIVIPYDADDVQWRDNANKVLVPYGRYVELWNQAHPDKKIGSVIPQREFAYAGAHYAVTLAEEDHLILQGTIDFELFTDSAVDVPLALKDGVVTSALLDGKPARLKAVMSAPRPVGAKQQSVQQRSAVPKPGTMLALLVEGKGRHQLKIAVRVAIQRQGGWRTAHAILPHAEATAVDVTVREPETSIRYPQGKAMLTETTSAADQRLAITLHRGGLFNVTWRAKISPGSKDQALTATSAALIDVREDGVRVVWQVTLTFGQTERGTFRLEVPADYLVEKVDGRNVRGWNTEKAAKRTFLTVELLKAVKQQEELVVHLSRRAAITSATANTFDAPTVAVPDAALHRGIVQIRRSPILELQTSTATGVTRTDGAGTTKHLDPLSGAKDSPLGVREYQAYQFNATPFRIAMSATQIQPRVSARVRTIFRIGETESTLESEVQFAPRQRAIYQAEIAIPTTLKLEKVAATGLTDWAIVQDQGHRILRAFFSTGHSESFAMSLEGKLDDHTAKQAVELPHLEVLGVDQQHGSMVVQVDPSLAARTTDLKGCQGVLLQRVTTWLTPAQRPLARLGLEYTGSSYSGKIQLTPRQPRVTCVTVTNVRTTYRDIQETILLDFNITEAGVRQICFQLPSWLQDANINAPQTRQKTITPIQNKDRVQVQLDLQDAITGQYRVVIENDRAISPGKQQAPLPQVEAANVGQQYVTLQNAGRDEIVVDATPGMEPVNRSSRQWEQLTARLAGGDFTTAYAVNGTSSTPAFGYHTKQRAMVVTAGATIGLARTELVLDASGTYRASLLLKIDNRTEPYLEIRLPKDAQLWTAHVAGQPVKPARSVNATEDALLRIPLIKTAEGDLDYDVVLKYAGQIDELRFLKAVEFPVIRTENINVELSQVKLYLPNDYRWYQFDGTTTRVASEEDFDAGLVAYQTQQVEKLTQIIRSANPFSQSRAVHNVEKLGKELQSLHEKRGRKRFLNKQLQMNLESNDRVLKAAQEEIKQLEGQQETSTDNRDALLSFYQGQQNSLARNSATRLSGNFRQPSQTAATTQPAKPKAPSKARFNANWFNNKLGSGSGAASTKRRPKKGRAQPSDDSISLDFKSSRGKAFSRLKEGESYRVQQQAQMPQESDAAQKVFQVEPQADSPADWGWSERSKRQQLGTKDKLNRAYLDKIQRLDRQQRGQVSAPQGEQRAQTMVLNDMLSGQGQSIEQWGTQQRGGTTMSLAGLTSLDFELPTRGQVFYFTTPRGEVKISARPVERELGDRLANFGALLAMLLALLVAAAIARRLARTRTRRIVTIVLLCGAGLLMTLLGILPIFGIALFFGAILLAIDWQRAQNDPATA